MAEPIEELFGTTTRPSRPGTTPTGTRGSGPVEFDVSAVLPGPSTVLGYYQDGRFYRELDDVNERADFYSIHSNNKIVLEKGKGGQGSAPQLIQSGAGVFGNAVNAGATTISNFLTGRSDSIPDHPGDPLAGNPANALRNPDPEMVKAIRAATAGLYGIPASQLIDEDPSVLITAYTTGRAKADSLEDGVALSDTDFYKQVTSTIPALGRDGGLQRDPDHEFTAGQPGVPSVRDRKRARDADGNLLVKDASQDASFAAAGAGGAGSGEGSNLGSGIDLPAGSTPDGVEVTPDLLREFVNSDFALGFNAAINNFRDAGAATVFLDWLQGQFTRFRGEALGDIANEALSGEIPTTNFTDFLERKGLLPGSGESTGVNEDFARLLGKGSGSSTSAAGTTPAGAAALPPDTAPAAPSAGDTLGSGQPSDVVAELLG